MTSSKEYSLTVGTVKNNSDPAQHGRLQVYVPSWDSEDFKVEDLPWCWYVTPMGGVTANIKTGREDLELPGISAYGMWAIPKNGAQVLVACLDGNPEMRIWMGCMFMPEHNRTLPSGINGITSEIDESGHYGQHDFKHMVDNLADAGLGKTDKHFRTRGGYSRSVSHPSNKNTNKPRDNGYASNPNEPAKADSQIWSMTTPGHHFIEMSDVKEESRIRLKTSEGNQIILDDTNERIYISTAKGRNYVELDETNGKIHIYSDSKVNIRSRNDINMYSDENINIVANKRLNLRSETRAVVVQAHHDVRVISTHADFLVTASRDIQLKTINGPQASAIAAETIVDAATWHQNPGGRTLIYRWAEKAGSASSSIRFDSAQELSGLAQAPISLTSAANFSIRSTGSVSVQGSTFNNVFGSVKWNVGDMGLIDTDGEGPFDVVAKGGASSPSVAPGTKALKLEEIIDHMVRPKHESWTRDEDEPKAPTKRGPNYQG
jgi:hypothetical protein